MPTIDFNIDALNSMKKYPKTLSYKGDLSLLKRPKVSIVGSRRPSSYSKLYTSKLSKELTSRGVVIVSGGAMGIDSVAHHGAGVSNTIAIYATGIDIRYPVVNKTLLKDIEHNGLAISQFDDTFKATSWSFVTRNELVVALGDILVVCEADINSGSMRSVEYALKMKKEIFVLPHRLGDSEGTNELLKKGLATPILDIDKFCLRFGLSIESDIPKDDFFYFCQTFPTLDDAVNKFGQRVYEAELEEIIKINNGVISLI